VWTHRIHPIPPYISASFFASCEASQLAVFPVACSLQPAARTAPTTSHIFPIGSRLNGSSAWTAKKAKELCVW
jgi:hypothetical protein